VVLARLACLPLQEIIASLRTLQADVVTTARLPSLSHVCHCCLRSTFERRAVPPLSDPQLTIRPMLRHIMTLMAFLCMLPASMAYNLVQEYNSLTFFDTWDFFGGPDDLTHGA
jgi:hypothetical protein